MSLTRRQLLLAGAGLTLASPLGAAAAGPSDLVIGQLRTGGEWNPRPNGIRRLLWEVAQRTSIEVNLEPVVVGPEEPALYRYPFIYWSGAGASPAFSEEAVRALRRHLTYGGTLFIDNADADPGGQFESSMRRELQRILPREELKPIPNDHVLYKTFFLVDGQAGRVLRSPHIDGIVIEKRIAVIYSANDLSGAWSRDPFGRWEYEVTPGGERQREMAFRLGINLVMYAMCLDYKEDLVHVPFIMKRRR